MQKFVQIDGKYKNQNVVIRKKFKDLTTEEKRKLRQIYNKTRKQKANRYLIEKTNFIASLISGIKSKKYHGPDDAGTKTQKTLLFDYLLVILDQTYPLKK